MVIHFPMTNFSSLQLVFHSFSIRGALALLVLAALMATHWLLNDSGRGQVASWWWNYIKVPVSLFEKREPVSHRFYEIVHWLFYYLQSPFTETQSGRIVVDSRRGFILPLVFHRV